MTPTKSQPALAPSSPALLRVAASTALLVLSFSACGGDDSDGPAPVKVMDQAGRTCSVPIDAIDRPTCDEDPMPSDACSGGATACFQLGSLDVAAQYKPAAICAACCTSNSSTGQSADCSGIVCADDADCPHAYPSCSDGQCFRER